MTACAYKDVSGLFTTEVPEELENSTSGKGSGAKKDTTVPVANTEVDDEDELLYGTIHILHKHLYSTKLNFTSKFFIRTGFFRQNKGISFSTLHFDKKFVKMLWLIKKRCLRNI